MFSFSANGKTYKVKFGYGVLTQSDILTQVSSMGAITNPKDMIKMLANLKLDGEKLLVVVKEYSENVILASRNLQNIMLLQANEVGVLDIVSAKKVLIEDAALESIKEVLK